jgi:hypothetical protein
VSPAERDKNLEQAQALIRAVALDLDRSSKPCRCCGSNRYTNLAEARTAEQLEAVAGKVGDAQRRLSFAAAPENS